MSDQAIRVSRVLQPLAEGIDEALEQVAGDRVAFTLFVWTEGRASFISSAERDIARRHIEELFKLWDQGMPDIPAHEAKH